MTTIVSLLIEINVFVLWHFLGILKENQRLVAILLSTNDYDA